MSPLSLPDTSRLPELRALARHEAVRLFAERARAVAAGFALTPQNVPAIARLCR